MPKWKFLLISAKMAIVVESDYRRWLQKRIKKKENS